MKQLSQQQHVAVYKHKEFNYRWVRLGLICPALNRLRAQSCRRGEERGRDGVCRAEHGQGCAEPLRVPAASPPARERGAAAVPR